MPRGHWRVILAAFGCLILAGQSEQGGAAQQRHQHQQRAADPAPVPQAPNTPSPEPAKGPCYPQADPHISCDGIAAKAAVDQALDADKAAAAIWPQFGVGVATLFAAIAAAIFAWRAAVHTRRGADASIDALAETRIANSLQLRPYISFDDIPNKPARFNRAQDAPLMFLVKNYGAMPASSVTLRIGQKTVFRPIKMQNAPIRQSAELGSIAPGATQIIGVSIDYPTEALSTAFDEKKTAILLKLRIDYRWVSGNDSEELELFFVKEHEDEDDSHHRLHDQARNAY